MARRTPIPYVNALIANSAAARDEHLRTYSADRMPRTGPAEEWF